MIKISVVIPTFNRKGLLKDCLQALFFQTYPKERFEIIVVDDGSTDGTHSLIKTLQKKNPNLYLFGQSRGGTSRARNLGIKNARGEIIAFTDDDCLSHKDWLEQLDNAFEKKPQALGIEGKTLTYPAKITPFTAQIVNLNGGGYQTCNIAYKRKILQKLGGFDEKFGLFHCDDVDFALMVLKRGSIHFEPKAIVVHPPRKTTFKRELTRVKQIPSEFRLFLKHPNYYQAKYGKKNLFSQVVFKNSIWIRLFHLKLYSGWIMKDPLIYLKFLTRTVLEIGLIIYSIPKFWHRYQRIKSEFMK